MTRSRAALCMAMLAVVPGCGTMCNVCGVEAPLIPVPVQPAPFGGVYRDFHWLGMVAADVPKEPERLWGCAFFLVDAPFSLAGDILTLPVVPFLSPPRELVEACRQIEMSNDSPPELAGEAKGP